ncbi:MULTISPECIES: hypothetical protein [Thiomicrorhabdus]|uniref:Lipoprotein n=1 Tax=Thiomicrorhabdus heinhorstiae TaxID=2748010 RepID=A0ABS0C445_9GAMM|nr:MULTISPECIES: hypothetical protein [Thiomicrorhabdus]MBF6058906.1 hypothetical protein [Thiomicrorhabdus heinhorstiae]
MISHVKNLLMIGFVSLSLTGCIGGSTTDTETDTTTSETSQTTATVPASVQNQYTLKYSGENIDGLIDQTSYTVIIASDNSLTIDSNTPLTDPTEEDFYETGTAQITWTNGDYAYVLSTNTDGSFNEINVLDTKNLTNNYPTFKGQFTEETSGTVVSNISVLTKYAGTYTVSGPGTTFETVRGTHDSTYTLPTSIMIASNGAITFDNSLDFSAEDIQAIYNRTNLDAADGIKRVQVNYGADDDGPVIQVYLDANDQVEEISYKTDISDGPKYYRAAIGDPNLPVTSSCTGFCEWQLATNYYTETDQDTYIASYDAISTAETYVKDLVTYHFEGNLVNEDPDEISIALTENTGDKLVYSVTLTGTTAQNNSTVNDPITYTFTKTATVVNSTHTGTSPLDLTPLAGSYTADNTTTPAVMGNLKLELTINGDGSMNIVAKNTDNADEVVYSRSNVAWDGEFDEQEIPGVDYPITLEKDSINQVIVEKNQKLVSGVVAYYLRLKVKMLPNSSAGNITGDIYWEIYY